MRVLLLASLLVTAAALLASLRVMHRSGDSRMALLAGLLALLGLQQAVATSLAGSGAALGLDLATATALAGLAAGALGLLTVLASGRTLGELDRAETLHWESMEGVRGLTELAARREIPLADRLPQLLAMGCDRLGLEIGLVSRVTGDRYEVLAVEAPEDFPLSAGAVLPLSDTHCARTLQSERPVALARAADAHWAEHPERTALRFEAYLASAVRVEGVPVGTLVFGARRPLPARFTATHKDLLMLMVQWIEGELERERWVERARRADARVRAAQAEPAAGDAAAARPPAEPTRANEAPLAAAPAATGAPGKRGARRARRARRPRVERRGRSRAPGLGLNSLLSQLEARIRRVAGEQVALVFEQAPQLARAREPRIPLEEIVLSLVGRASDALPEGGTLTLTTADHEPAMATPHELPAVVPDRYVTLTISESGGGLEPDLLTRAFESDSQEGAETRGGDPRLPLATVYRMLQRVGGDLSVEVEPGRGSRFTLYLPRLDTQAPARSRPALSARPGAPPPIH